MERYGSHLVWEVRTDFGTVCAGRTAILTQSDRKRQGSAHPGVDPPWGGLTRDRLSIQRGNACFAEDVN